MLGLGLKLLGIGKAIIGWFLGIIQGLFAWCKSNPLLALAIAVDIVLVAGCWWGYTQHRDSMAKDVTITQLHKDIKDKDTLIETLYKRIKEYAVALQQAQTGRVQDIRQHNEEVQNLRKIAEDQLVAAQKEAERTKKQRDSYFTLSEKYRHALVKGGTPEERIAREEKINGEFIRDIQGVR